MIQKIDDSLIVGLIREAQHSPRKRKNYNFHQNPEDPINRMLNAFEPGTYCRPHKHENPDKREIFIGLKGRLAMVLFSNSGDIEEINLLDPKKGSYGIEVPPGIWHTVVVLESGSVVYEIKDGPYCASDDKIFAPWAPEEGSSESCKYLATLEEQIKKLR